MRPTLARCRLLLALPVLALAARAQTTVLRLPDPIPGFEDGGFASALGGVSDVDGDGLGDLLVGSPLESTLLLVAGAVRVYSGADGALLHLVRGNAAGEFFGSAVCGLGDVDGDGAGDFAAGWGSSAPLGGSARIYSGATGALLNEVPLTDPQQGFRDLAAAGDVDADGVIDIIVPGRELPQGPTVEAGRAWIYSGASGALLLDIAGLSVPFLVSRGTWVAHAGDVDHDGRADVVVASAWPYASAIVRVISGASGRLLHAFSGALGAEEVRVPAGAAGDWNSDGRDDVFLFRVETPAHSNPARLEIRSGVDGALLQSIAPQGSESLTNCAPIGDADGDGRVDLALASAVPQGAATWRAAIRVLAGGSGQPLYALDRELSVYAYSMPLAAAGDVSGDGLGDVVYGEPSPAPAAVVFSALELETGIPRCPGGSPGYPCPCGNDDWPASESGCINSTGAGAKLRGFGIHLHLNDDLELLVTDAPADALLVLLRSTGLGIDPPILSDGRPCLFAPWVVSVTHTDASGSKRIELAPGLAEGQSTYFQCWYRDELAGAPCGTGSNFTQALQVKAE